MQHFEDEFVISGRSPDEVFAYLSDPGHVPEWMSAAKESRTEGDPGVGCKLTLKAGMLGVSFNAEQAVTAYEPGRHYAWSGDKPFHAAYDFTLTAVDDGTQVTAVGEADPGSFFKVGGGMVGHQLKKEFHGDNARLKKVLETA